MPRLAKISVDKAENEPSEVWPPCLPRASVPGSKKRPGSCAAARAPAASPARSALAARAAAITKKPEPAQHGDSFPVCLLRNAFCSFQNVFVASVALLFSVISGQKAAERTPFHSFPLAARQSSGASLLLAFFSHKIARAAPLSSAFVVFTSRLAL